MLRRGSPFAHDGNIVYTRVRDYGRVCASRVDGGVGCSVCVTSGVAAPVGDSAIH